MKTFGFLFLLLTISMISAQAQTAKVEASDLQVLEGKQWVGELSYLDYSSNKKTSIKSNVTVTRSGDLTWTFDYQYPLEPKANNKDEVKLSSEGVTFDDEKVLERLLLPDGILKIVTTRTGTDNNRDAVFRRTYLFGKSSFSIRKEVKIAGTDLFFERNNYIWTR